MSGLLTTTCGSAAGRVSAELRLSPAGYLSRPPPRAIPARPATTHSFADARPLVRRPLFSTRWSDVRSVSVTIPLVLLMHCCYYLRNLNQKKSMRLFPDLTNQIG